jgi:hypothetical protein
MIHGEQVPIVIKMREYLASLKPLDLRSIILDILRQLAPRVEELQRQQWRNNTLQSGSKMGNYEPSTIKRYNKASPIINLFEKGEMYRDVKATVDETLKNMFVLEVKSDRWAKNYIWLAKNKKIGTNEDGDPGFMGLTEENANIIRNEFTKLLNERLGR